MDCIFCKIAKKELASNVLYEDNEVIVIMDISPTVDGHTLIIPKKHYTDYTELDTNILNHIFEVAKKISPILMEKLNTKSITFLINYGDDQKVKHFHLHLLPDLSSKAFKPQRTVEENFKIITS